MRRQATALALVASAWLAAGGPLLADGIGSSHKHGKKAKTCYVDTLHYKNKGDYTVETLDLWYVKKDKKYVRLGKDNSGRLGDDILKGGDVTVDLNKFEGGDKGDLQNGTEVWVRVNIQAGDSPSCHKDGHKLVYWKDVGRSIHFVSQGSTLKDNRCQYEESISKQCNGLSPAAQPK